MPPQMNDGMDEQFSYNGSERKSSKSIGKPKKK